MYIQFIPPKINFYFSLFSLDISSNIIIIVLSFKVNDPKTTGRIKNEDLNRAGNFGGHNLLRPGLPGHVLRAEITFRAPRGTENKPGAPRGVEEDKR